MALNITTATAAPFVTLYELLPVLLRRHSAGLPGEERIPVPHILEMAAGTLVEIEKRICFSKNATFMNCHAQRKYLTDG